MYFSSSVGDDNCGGIFSVKMIYGGLFLGSSAGSKSPSIWVIDVKFKESFIE